MDSSLKKQFASGTSLAKAVALVAGLSVLTLISGCTEQSASTRSIKADMTQSVPAGRPADDDFAFPAQPSSLARGREVFRQNCASCHAAGYWQTQKVKEDIAFTTPIDTYQMLTHGVAPDVEMPTAQRQPRLPKHHAPGPFLEKINREDRWAVIFYTRYLAGAGDIRKPNRPNAPEVAAIFGGNCAVCHGTRGQADGPLHTSKTGNHELHDGKLLHALVPAPANFQQKDRMFNRTDAQLYKYICQGIYPSAMPSWYGDVERDKDSGKVVFVFDDNLIWNLVRHVRTFTYNNDLPESLPEAKTPPPGLVALQSCQPQPNNRPWTQSMRQNAPKGSQAYTVPAGDPVTGGMILPGQSNTQPIIHEAPNFDRPTQGGHFGP